MIGFVKYAFLSVTATVNKIIIIVYHIKFYPNCVSVQYDSMIYKTVVYNLS